jgi:glutamine amidotransferase
MSSLINVIDIGIGNLGSVINMLIRAGATVNRISDPQMLLTSKKVILPGVGSFDAMVQRLNSSGFRNPIIDYANSGNYLLGICLGMHLLADTSEEGEMAGLGLIPGRVRKFRFESEIGNYKVPHMGWNTVKPLKNHALINGLGDDARFYFVHSYYYDCMNRENELLNSHHGSNFTSGIQRDNIMGLQFHPEKSHRYGMQILKNFIDL